jgi:hypothetical protein
MKPLQDLAIPFLASAGLCLSLPAQLTWNLTAPSGPSTRAYTAAAFDTFRGQAVLFGGSTYTANNPWNQFAKNDTWIWQGGQWQQAAPAHVPPGRFRHALAYDPVRHVVVMGGGMYNQSQSGQYIYRTDTWEWDGTDWTQINTNTPFPSRTQYAMAYDPFNQGILLFGGEWQPYPNDTWLFDGTDWIQLAPLHAPGPRFGHGMVYDSTRQRVDLVGGYGSGVFQKDHWTWDGTDWLQLPDISQQGGIFRVSMFHDPSRGRTVVYGPTYSNAFFTETWEYDGATWSLATPVASPTTPCMAFNFYDTWMGVGVSFLGANGQTWTYEPPTPASAITYAPGCPGSAGTPDLRLVRRPILGDTYELAVDNLAPQSLTFLMLGWSQPTLPVHSITQLAAATCVLRTSTEYVASLIGSNVYTLAIPSDPVFLGAALNNQAVTGEVVNGNLVSISVSNALRMTMGNP